MQNDIPEGDPTVLMLHHLRLAALYWEQHEGRPVIREENDMWALAFAEFIDTLEEAYSE